MVSLQQQRAKQMIQRVKQETQTPGSLKLAALRRPDFSGKKLQLCRLNRFYIRICVYFRTHERTNALLTECLILVHSAQFIKGGGCFRLNLADLAAKRNIQVSTQEEHISARNRKMV
jgi:hypothetical protein